MPPRDLAAYVRDAVDAWRAVSEYAAGMELQQFRADRRTRDAVERRPMIVGEAVGHIRRPDAGLAATLGPVERIIAFRNILAHGYFSVDDETLWLIATKHAPALLSVAESILATMPPPEWRAD